MLNVHSINKNVKKLLSILIKEVCLPVCAMANGNLPHVEVRKFGWGYSKESSTAPKS